MLQEIGGESKFYDLSQMKIAPCTGCVKCGATNRCVQRDDMTPLYDEIVAAEALVIGAVNFFGHPNAFTRLFLERLYPLRHNEPQTKDKVAAVIAAGGSPDEIDAVAQELAYHMKSYFDCQVVGEVAYASWTPPCYICGFGTTCPVGLPARKFSSEEFAAFNEITPDMFHHFEDEPEAVERLHAEAAKVRKALSQSSVST
jgi:hypothetical protein